MASNRMEMKTAAAKRVPLGGYNLRGIGLAKLWYYAATNWSSGPEQGDERGCGDGETVSRHFSEYTKGLPDAYGDVTRAQ